MAEVEFIYNGVKTIILCKINDKMKEVCQKFKEKANIGHDTNIFYSYDGKIGLNEELTFEQTANSEDKKRNKMNILVLEAIIPNQNQTKEIIINSKNIICPECKEDIKFSIDDYVINLFECKNKHDIDNIFLDKFDSTQNINISQIKYEICGKYNKGNMYNNIFYRCYTCKKDICPICHSKHDKEHEIVNYDDKNYFCEKHNKIYIAYCYDCKENICMFCEQDHNGHKIITFGKLIPDINKMKNLLKQLEEKKINYLMI